jgi:proteasome accessory factor B
MGRNTSNTPDQLSRPPLERMMRIHAMLAKGGYPNTSTISRELEVSPKTAQRDLEFMTNRLNLPLKYHPQRFGYFYTEPVESFPTLQVTEGEIFALLVAEKAVQQYRGSPFEDRLKGAFRKLAESLPETVTLNLADWDRAFSFRTSAEPILHAEVMEALSGALQKRQQLRLAYRKPGAQQSEERIVDPYHLANINGDWYLFAFDQLRQAIRTFAPARILSVEPTGKIFARPARFVLEQQLQDSFGVHSREGDFKVVLHFDSSVADYIREKRWHPSQKLTELPEGGVELRLRLGSLGEVNRWVLGWGGACRVIGPDLLKESVRRAAEQILRASEPVSQ